MSPASPLPWVRDASASPFPAPRSDRHGAAWPSGSSRSRTPSSRRRRPFSPHRLRRLAAAALVGVVVWLAITAVAPAPPPREVVVLATDLPAGHVLTAADLTVQRVEESLRPESAVAGVDAAVGRRLARPHRAREIVMADGLATTRHLAPDDRAVHVPIADPGALLATRPGDRVDVAEGTAGALVASDVLVLAVDDPASDTGGHGVVVAVPADRLATLVPAMSPTGPGVTLALRNTHP